MPNKTEDRGKTKLPVHSKERRDVALLYRARMISAQEACRRIGIQRPAFYAYLQNYFGAKNGEFPSRELDLVPLREAVLEGSDALSDALELAYWEGFYLGRGLEAQRLSDVRQWPSRTLSDIKGEIKNMRHEMNCMPGKRAKGGEGSGNG